MNVNNDFVNTHKHGSQLKTNEEMLMIENKNGKENNTNTIDSISGSNNIKL